VLHLDHQLRGIYNIPRPFGGVFVVFAADPQFANTLQDYGALSAPDCFTAIRVNKHLDANISYAQLLDRLVIGAEPDLESWPRKLGANFIDECRRTSSLIVCPVTAAERINNQMFGCSVDKLKYISADTVTGEQAGFFFQKKYAFTLQCLIFWMVRIHLFIK
jgi:hypothetical protein